MLRKWKLSKKTKQRGGKSGKNDPAGGNQRYFDCAVRAQMGREEDYDFKKP